MVKLTIIYKVIDKDSEESLNSILQQQFSDFEVISITDSLNLLESMPDDRRITVYEDNNLTENLDDITAKAKGDYVLFTDSNHIFSSSALDEINEKIIQSNADLLMFKSTSSCESNEERYLSRIVNNKTFTIEKIKDKLFDLDVSISNKVFRKEFLTAKNIKIKKLTENYGEFIHYKTLMTAEKIFYTDTQLYTSQNDKTGNPDESSFREYIITQNSILKLFDNQYSSQAANNKISKTVGRYEKIPAEYKKTSYEILKQDFVEVLKRDDADEFITSLTSDNRKKYEQVIISDSVEEYELLKRVYEDKKSVNTMKRYNEILESEHKKIKNFNNSLTSSNSWKLTKILRIRKRG